MHSVLGAFGSILSTTKMIMTKREAQNEQAMEAMRKTQIVQNIKKKKKKEKEKKEEKSLWWWGRWLSTS